MPDTVKLLIICGPTASGKSELAIRLARELDGEIINADSMQVYRGMDIGTAKPCLEERQGITHHLIDVSEPNQLFSAADFADAADKAIRDITSRGKRAIVAGGTGLYIRSLLHGLVDSPSGAGEVRARLQQEAAELGNLAILERLRQVDPQLASRIHPNNLVRIIRALEVHQLTGVPLSSHQQKHGFAGTRYESLKIGIRIDRQQLYHRIEQRVEQMLASGLIDEVASLLARGYSRDLKSMRSIGYKEISALLAGEISHDESVRLIKRDTRRYAKRQLTWFNADNGIIWLEYPKNFDNILTHAIDFFNR
ncbi:MAG TPA: tRNA (adenosine(37)-N6)-dimethylallyltransferase MiaA [Deltaproteobacteria bacterium]|nr:tRNA (adenosine(37)-N6)-dimethylallyltransferase MiaA [Deltaproteobacteria bacterium]HQB39380.1 tRNA (adenosine(37)-N6)-dimethylallyltransferase MiaA [Deltaproteobacteria bacterium]